VLRLIALAAAAFSMAPSSLIAKELTVQTGTVPGNKSVSYLRVELSSVNVRVLTPLVPLNSALPPVTDPGRASRGLYLSDYLKLYRAIAVMAGGYIESYSPPTALGFVKSNGISTARAHDSWLTDGVFCSDVGRAIIQPSGSTVDRSSFRDCLQAGPLLLGKDIPSSQETPGYQKLAQSVQEQTFICIDNQNRLVLGVTDKIDLATLIHFLSSPDMGCVSALRLTGLDTSGLRFGSQLFGHDDYLFPSAIGIFQR
jgi:hypothetical protein